MDKFLEGHIFPEWRQVGNLNSPMSKKKKCFLINYENLLTSKVPGPNSFTSEFCQIFEKQLIQICIKSLENASQLICMTSISLVLKQGCKTLQETKTTHQYL